MSDLVAAFYKAKESGDAAALIKATAECELAGYHVSPDGYVSETGAVKASTRPAIKKEDAGFLKGDNKGVKKGADA